MNDLLDNFVVRLIIAMLLPNVLVWGFWEAGINNDRSLLWRSFVGPYWHLECLAIICIGLAALLAGLRHFWRTMGQTLTLKRDQIGFAKQRARDRSQAMNGEEIDRDGLLDRLQRVVRKLERVQRVSTANL